MSYLIAADYRKQIQDQNLQAVITSTPSIQSAAELAAQAECISYLVQKYDVKSEFTDTLPYDPGKVYNAGDRAYLSASAYSATATYALGALVLQAGQVFICTTTINAGEVFTPGHWQLLGNQFDIFFAILPAPLFQLGFIYDTSDLVFWKGHKYTCRISTQPYSQDVLLQFANTTSIPPNNVFPDDRRQGPTYWTDNGAYTAPAGSLLNLTYFTPGDNRNQQLVMFLIDITLYHLHSRIAPKNIPELRMDRYHAAIAWLKMAAKGTDITAGITRLQPTIRGSRFRWGSNIKTDNSY